MMNHLYFYIMPVLNVDGYHFSWTNVSDFAYAIEKRGWINQGTVLEQEGSVAAGLVIPELQEPFTPPS